MPGFRFLTRYICPQVYNNHMSPSRVSLGIYVERLTLRELSNFPIPPLPICEMGLVLLCSFIICPTVLESTRAHAEGRPLQLQGTVDAVSNPHSEF